MRSASSPPTVGSTTISNSVVITSMPTSIARLAMPPSARGTMLPKLRLQPDPSAAGFAHHASATGNLTMPAWGISIDGKSANAITALRVKYVCVLVEVQAPLFTADAVAHFLPIGGTVRLTPHDDDHRDIRTAPVAEIGRVEQVFEAAIGLPNILAALCRLDLNGK